jgi:Flp pilus assembly pilin Flp
MSDFLKTLYFRVLARVSADDGQGLTEYALIFAFVAIVAMVGLHFLGGKVSDQLSTVASSIQT